VAASVAFYGDLFGSEAPELPPESGGYRMFELGGVAVAGCSPIMMEGQPPAWLTYVSVDDAGAACALWQPRAHIGAGLVNEPGALAWNELSIRDTVAATAFYTRVFGWEAGTIDMGGTAYTEWKLAGATRGGMMEMPAEAPPRYRRTG
jgi:predicted enzyme related to lactoylglutathione lyase